MCLSQTHITDLLRLSILHLLLPSGSFPKHVLIDVQDVRLTPLSINNRTEKIKNTVHKHQNSGKVCTDYSNLSHKIFGMVKGGWSGR